MQDCSDCGCDYIELRDGDRSTSSIIGRYCSSTMPSKIISTGNQLYVKFVTDGSNQYSGFKATFRKGIIHYSKLMKIKTYLVTSFSLSSFNIL